jgi:aryl sulfotransferase
MANPAIDWPHKTRELHNHHFDSTIWNRFKFRDGDIVIATYPNLAHPGCSRSSRS